LEATLLAGSHFPNSARVLTVRDCFILADDDLCSDERGENAMKRGVLSTALKAVLGAVVLLLYFCVEGWPQGLRKVIAVSQFENKTAYGGEIGEGMADQLVQALVKSTQFAVVERQTLLDVTAEQDWAKSGRMQSSQSAQTGKLVSAQVHVKGTITEFESRSTSSDSRISLGGIKVGGKREEAHVGLILRVIETTSGHVLLSERVEKKSSSTGVDLAAARNGVDFGSQNFVRTPLGKATQLAIDECVAIIVGRLRKIPFECSVVKADEGEVIISAGEKTGARSGDLFDVFDKGEELTDPVTGESLGSEEIKIAKIQIYEVAEKYSKAKIVNSSKQIQRGDIARHE
jgi:curli biogenesis system outer membrane secretion channel CsgG